MGFTALQDRLSLTLFECREGMQLSRSRTSFVVDVLADPPASTLFYLVVSGSKAMFTSGASPTPSSVSAGLAAAISALGIVGLVVSDGGGSIALSHPTTAFELFLGPYLDIEPETPEDFLVLTFRDVALQMADEYLNNPFAEVDRFGAIVEGSEKPIPKPVIAGVKQLLAMLWAQAKADADAATGTTTVAGDVTEKKVGDVTIKYGSTSYSSTTSSAIADIKGAGLPSLVRVILDLYRFTPGAFVPWAPTRLRTQGGLGLTAELAQDEELT